MRILITGGSRGIGRACVELFAKQNHDVVFFYCKNAFTADEICKQYANVSAVQCDVSSPDEVRAAVAECIEKLGGIDVLINNAGIRRDGLMVFMEDNDWADVMRTNLDSFFYLTKLVVNPMIRARRGRIVNITSISGVTGLPGQVNYSSAKAALIGATKALSKELAARKITVNAVAPGFIATDMTAELDESELKKTIPMGRFGQPEEVAALVSFLVSEQAAYITGQTINIAGGLG